ncbi:50S ribosomal protein L28 [bacterium]|nr:50S ribosomal protein L28 [bacterium]MBU1599638.1 50S ribosomal protein L28 [bacterium]MBU2461841.1 50S ribosomal protein L28 [bacterium]
MSKICDICGKRPLTGNAVSHSNRKTKKRQLPNLHSAKRQVGLRTMRMNLCTKCLRNT